MAVYRVNSDGEITLVHTEQFFYSWDLMDFDENGIVHRRLADVGTFEEIIDRIIMSDRSDESDFRIFDIETGNRLKYRRECSDLKHELINSNGEVIAVAYQLELTIENTFSIMEA